LLVSSKETFNLLQESPSAHSHIKEDKRAVCFRTFSDVASRRNYTEPGTDLSRIDRGESRIALFCSTSSSSRTQHALRPTKFASLLQIQVLFPTSRARARAQPWEYTCRPCSIKPVLAPRRKRCCWRRKKRRSHPDG